MSTSNSASTLTTQFTFAEIDQKIEYLRSPDGAKSLTPRADPTAQMVIIYGAVRPIILVMLGLPLIPPAWRAVLKLFVANLDTLANAFDPTFKAGKDL